MARPSRCVMDRRSVGRDAGLQLLEPVEDHDNLAVLRGVVGRGGPARRGSASPGRRPRPAASETRRSFRPSPGARCSASPRWLPTSSHRSRPCAPGRGGRRARDSFAQRTGAPHPSADLRWRPTSSLAARAGVVCPSPGTTVSEPRSILAHDLIGHLIELGRLLPRAASARFGQSDALGTMTFALIFYIVLCGIVAYLGRHRREGELILVET